jgi:hydroxypyruvate reductase
MASTGYEFREQRREHALQILKAGLKAVDPYEAVKKALNLTEDGRGLLFGGNHYYLENHERILVVGAGKATALMACAVSDILGERITAGAINLKYHHLPDRLLNSRIKITEAGHPVLDEAGINGTRTIVELLQNAGEKDLVICLISGGGSALLEMPVPGVTLADMQTLTSALLKAGATINQLNVIRKHLSQVKGGQLARLAQPAQILSLILSDVVGSPLDIIGSGPTVPDTSTYAQAWSFLENFDLASPDKIPVSIINYLQKGIKGEIADTPKPDDPLFARTSTLIVGDNRLAALAALEEAQTLGYNTLLLSTYLEGEAREVGKALAGIAKEVAANNNPIAKPACLIAGGETTVTVRGDGSGGRNTEMALAISLAIENWHNILIVPLATDGTDGPTNAAGAFAEGNTVERAHSADLDPYAFLSRNDSYHFFEHLSDLIKTGPTQTNVNDLILLLITE